ncbi:hypothetical protein ACIQAD_09665 [Streptomyces sp. NPDC088551]|uniref:hypothetical protein n=1 Tax=Streptomyces sp. NPDC088551 TaxID=3365863 RepID=UPI00380C6620
MNDDKKFAYGYMRVFSDVAGQEAYEVERSLRRYAEANDLHLGGIYHEFVSGSLDAFNEMVEVLRCTGVGTVILPSLGRTSARTVRSGGRCWTGWNSASQPRCIRLMNTAAQPVISSGPGTG